MLYTYIEYKMQLKTTMLKFYNLNKIISKNIMKIVYLVQLLVNMK